VAGLDLKVLMVPDRYREKQLKKIFLLPKTDSLVPGTRIRLRNRSKEALPKIMKKHSPNSNRAVWRR